MSYLSYMWGKAISAVFGKMSELFNRILYQFAAPRSKTEKLSAYSKILITKVDGIGDFVLFTATLPSYRELFKDSYIILIVADGVESIADNCPYVDEVWALDPIKFRKNFIERWRWCRKIVAKNFDLAINARYSIGSDRFMDCLAGWSK